MTPDQNAQFCKKAMNVPQHRYSFITSTSSVFQPCVCFSSYLLGTLCEYFSLISSCQTLYLCTIMDFSFSIAWHFIRPGDNIIVMLTSNKMSVRCCDFFRQLTFKSISSLFYPNQLRLSIRLARTIPWTCTWSHFSLLPRYIRIYGGWSKKDVQVSRKPKQFSYLLIFTVLTFQVSYK